MIINETYVECLILNMSEYPPKAKCQNILKLLNSSIVDGAEIAIVYLEIMADNRIYIEYAGDIWSWIHIDRNYFLPYNL